MRKALLFFLLLMWQYSEAQLVKSSSKIIIKYADGGNSWAGNPGISAREELFEITPHRQGFKITKYLKVNSIAGIDGGIVCRDTTAVNTRGYKQISKPVLDSIFTRLTTTKPNFTAGFIKPLLKTPSKDRIKAIAARLDARDTDTFYQDMVKDAEVEDIVKIQQFNKLDSFVNLNRPHLGLYTTVVDVWDFVRIDVINNNDTTRFNGDFFLLLGQPFEVYKKNHIQEEKQHLNLEINNTIAAILPQSSALRKRVEIESITDDYIKWYLQKFL